MRNPRQRHRLWRRVAHDAAGFSLLELLVAMSMFAVVLLAVLSIYDTAAKDAQNEAERGVALSEESTGIASMVQELREAYKVNAPIGATTSSYMDVLARIPGSGDERLFFNCAYADPTSGYDDCVRYAAPAGTTFTAGVVPSGVTGVIVVQRVANGTTSDPNDPVFNGMSTPSASGSQPTFGFVTVKTPSKGSLASSKYTHLVVLNNAFYMPNLDWGH